MPQTTAMMAHPGQLCFAGIANLKKVVVHLVMRIVLAPKNVVRVQQLIEEHPRRTDDKIETSLDI